MAPVCLLELDVRDALVVCCVIPSCHLDPTYHASMVDMINSNYQISSFVAANLSRLDRVSLILRVRQVAVIRGSFPLVRCPQREFCFLHSKNA